MRKLLLTLLALIIIADGVFLTLPTLLDRHMNSVATPAPYPASKPAQKLHQTLFVADLHDDALLWQRNLLERHDYGHSDLPRLLEGHVGLQMFSTVTKTPRGLNYESNGANTDNITLLVMAQRWPQATWNSLLERALYQGRKLQEAADGSQGRLQLIRTRVDLSAFIATWQKIRSMSPPCSPPKACTRWKASWKTSTACTKQAFVLPA